MQTRTEEEPATQDQTLLVLLAQSGDRGALERLLREAYAPLRRYITYLAGAALADDILQETSLQIFRKLPHLAGAGCFSPVDISDCFADCVRAFEERAAMATA